MRFPDLMTLSPTRALVSALLLGIGAAFLGLMMPTILGGRGAEMGVLALMLTALPAIWILPAGGSPPSHASWIRQWAVYVAYFIGLALCFSAWCMIRPPQEVWNTFGFVADLPEVKLITLAEGHFPPALELIPHNLGVALAIGILSFIYGVAGGFVLLTWNVCVWSIALTMLLRRSAEVYGIVSGMLAVMPHALVELSAYAMVIVATIRFRRSKNPSSGEKKLMAIMLLAALLLVVLAACIEARWPSWILGQSKN
jgi:hypothetical protein